MDFYSAEAVIFLIAELDNPFRGQVSIGPDAIARVYADVMKPRQTATTEQAMAMLARAVTAVQADKTKALSMFNTGEGGFLDGEHNNLPSTLRPLFHRDADDPADASVALYLNTGQTPNLLH